MGARAGLLAFYEAARSTPVFIEGRVCRHDEQEGGDDQNLPPAHPYRCCSLPQRDQPTNEALDELNCQRPLQRIELRIHEAGVRARWWDGGAHLKQRHNEPWQIT